MTYHCLGRFVKEMRDAFKSLFETYFTPLCRFIYLHLDDKNVAEELAMDIFIYLWENRETFQIQLSLKAYLFQAAKNKCLNELRKKKETVGLDGVEDLYDQYQCVDSRNRGIISFDSGGCFFFTG